MSSGQTSKDSAPQGKNGLDTTSDQSQMRLFNLKLQTRMKEDKAIKDGIEDAQKSVKDRKNSQVQSQMTSVTSQAEKPPGSERFVADLVKKGEEILKRMESMDAEFDAMDATILGESSIPRH